MNVEGSEVFYRVRYRGKRVSVEIVLNTRWRLEVWLVRVVRIVDYVS